MYLINMRPGQLKKAVADRLPVIIVAGSVEYHGPQNPIGVDYLIPNSVIEAVEKRCPDDCVVAPHIVFAPTMNWAASIEEGDVDFSPQAMHDYAYEMITHIVGMGFRKIFVLQHHQGHDGLQGSCFKKIAAQISRDVSRTWGHSWGRENPAVNNNPNIGDYVFGLVQIVAIDTFSEYNEKYPRYIPIGHGGKGETQLTMAGYPETVDMAELDNYEGPLPSWLKDAHEATLEQGKFWQEFCVDGWVKMLKERRLKA